MISPRSVLTRYKGLTRINQVKTRNASSSSTSPIGIGQLNDQEFQKIIEKGKLQLSNEFGYHKSSIWVQNICWGDHDQFQHVNNVHYVRFLESNRMLFAEKISKKFSKEKQLEIVKGTGKSFILQKVLIKYRKPVTYPDTLLIGKKPVLPLQSDRFTLESGIFSLTQQSIVAIAEEVCVCYDYKTLSKIQMPKDFEQALLNIAENPNSDDAE